MKSQRQTKILEIIASKDIETQEQLLEELRQAGFRSTQATISRDIKELRILKDLTAMGTYRYSIGTKETSGAFSSRLNTIFKESVISYDYVDFVVGQIRKHETSARKRRLFCYALTHIHNNVKLYELLRLF